MVSHAETAARCGGSRRPTGLVTGTIRPGFHRWEGTDLLMWDGITLAVLACLSAGWGWQQFRVAAGKPVSRSQIVLGGSSAVQRTSGALLVVLAVLFLSMGLAR